MGNRRIREPEMQGWLKTVGRRVRRVRESQGLSRGDLVGRIAESGDSEVSPTTIQNVEAGKAGTLRTLKCIADAMEMPLAALLDNSSPLGSPRGLRTFQQGLQAFGFAAKLSRREVRVDIDGGGSTVHTVEGLHRTWYEGRVEVRHEVIRGGDPHGRLALTEHPLEILDRTEGLEVVKGVWVPEGEGAKRRAQSHRLLYELNLPRGLGNGSLSYRYGASLTAQFQMFAEVNLLKPEEIRPYINDAGVPDVPPEHLPGLVSRAEKEYERLTPEQKRGLVPGVFVATCGQFPIERLVSTVRFPEGYRPPFYEVRCWPGKGVADAETEDITADILPPGSPGCSFALEEDPCRLRLEVRQPYMGVAYAVLWWSPPFREFWPLYRDFLKRKEEAGD